MIRWGQEWEEEPEEETLEDDPEQEEESVDDDPEVEEQEETAKDDQEHLDDEPEDDLQEARRYKRDITGRNCKVDVYYKFYMIYIYIYYRVYVSWMGTNPQTTGQFHFPTSLYLLSQCKHNWVGMQDANIDPNIAPHKL